MTTLNTTNRIGVVDNPDCNPSAADVETTADLPDTTRRRTGGHIWTRWISVGLRESCCDCRRKKEFFQMNLIESLRTLSILITILKFITFFFSLLLSPRILFPRILRDTVHRLSPRSSPSLSFYLHSALRLRHASKPSRPSLSDLSRYFNDSNRFSCNIILSYLLRSYSTWAPPPASSPEFIHRPRLAPVSYGNKLILYGP